MRIKDYLIYIRDCYKYEQLCKQINELFNYKRQYAFGQHYGSVTEAYSDEEKVKLYGSKLSHITKSILYCMGIYEHQQKGIDYLIRHQEKFKDIYSFVDDTVVKELIEKYPRMKEIKDKWSWGSDLKYYYEEGYDVENPREREIDCDIVELTCNGCYEEFEVLGRIDEIDGEIYQCPQCGKELKVQIEYEPAIYTEVV